MKRKALFILVCLVVSTALAACRGTPQTERDAQATKIAADIMATQTAEAPTPTNTPMPTPTSIPLTATSVPPSSTPTPTNTLTPLPPTHTPTPTDTPTPTPTHTPTPTPTFTPTRTPIPTSTPIGTPTPTPIPTLTTLDIRAYIDGRSHLIIQGDTVHWHHLDYAVPGRWQGANEPTYLDEVTWYPAWPEEPDSENRENRDCDCDSSIYIGILPLAMQGQIVSLDIIQARHSVTIIQQPNAVNDYTLIVEFDDNPLAEADWYEISIDYLH